MLHRAIRCWVRSARRATQRTWPILALLGLTGFCLSPAIGSGYWAEDIYYSAIIPSSPILHHTSWFAETMMAVQHSIQVGRFYPITPIITAVAFQLFQNVPIYKCYIIAVTLLDVILYYFLIRRLSGQKRFATLATLCTVVLFQFRLTVDPILGYYAQIQWVTALFFICLIALTSFLDGQKSRWLWLSSLAYLACNLTYEMTYTLVLIPILLIWQARPGWRRGFGMATPFAMSAGLCAGMTVIVRHWYPSANYVHTTDFGFRGVLWSLACQLSAGLPLSYYAADPLLLFSKGRNATQWVEWLLQPSVIFVLIGTLLLSFRLLSHVRRLPSHKPGAVPVTTLMLLGGMLATLPALLIAISPYHRCYLSLGVGWIGVMVQYYGIGLLMALTLWRVVEQSGRRGLLGRGLTLGVVIVLAGLMGVTFRANIEVATAINAPPGSERYRQFAADHGAAWYLHRQNLVAALDSGIMDAVPDGSRVQLANRYPFWHDQLYGQFFYTKQTRKRIETLPSQFPSELPPNAPLYRVRDLVRDRKIGLVIVSKVFGSARASTTMITEPEPALIFVRHPSIQASGCKQPMLLVGRTPVEATDHRSATPRVFKIDQSLPRIRSGSGWGLFRLIATQPVDLDSLKLVDDPIQVASWEQPSASAQTANRTSAAPISR